MTDEQARQQVLEYLLTNADEALDSASAEMTAGRTRFAMNRIYYACFYATSAVLLAEGLSFSRHSGVRSALHRYLVKTGRISVEFGQFYDDMFEDRQEGDYGVLVEFDQSTVQRRLETGRRFLVGMRQLLANPASQDDHQAS